MGKGLRCGEEDKGKKEKMGKCYGGGLGRGW